MGRDRRRNPVRPAVDVHPVGAELRLREVRDCAVDRVGILRIEARCAGDCRCRSHSDWEEGAQK
jgi:hypothetical protein